MAWIALNITMERDMLLKRHSHNMCTSGDVFEASKMLVSDFKNCPKWGKGKTDAKITCLNWKIVWVKAKRVRKDFQRRSIKIEQKPISHQANPTTQRRSKLLDPLNKERQHLESNGHNRKATILRRMKGVSSNKISFATPEELEDKRLSCEKPEGGMGTKEATYQTLDRVSAIETMALPL